jgi:hypothetical protein
LTHFTIIIPSTTEKGQLTDYQTWIQLSLGSAAHSSAVP